MEQSELDAAFKHTLDEWLSERYNTTPDERMAKFFFFAGASFGSESATAIFQSIYREWLTGEDFAT